MHIEDKDRLYQKDLREKNKRKRFEVRYDVEADTRKEGMAQFERDQDMRLNKVSIDRFKEQMARGFDIVTHEALEANDSSDPPTEASESDHVAKTKVYEYYRTLQEQKRKPGVWSRAMNTVNREFMTEEEKIV